MKLVIRVGSVKLTQRQRSVAERRAKMLLARFDERIERAQLELVSAEGPRGGQHVLCRVEIRMRPRRVSAECTDPDAGADPDTYADAHTDHGHGLVR